MIVYLNYNLISSEPLLGSTYLEYIRVIVQGMIKISTSVIIVSQRLETAVRIINRTVERLTSYSSILNCELVSYSVIF
jgi:hypothetical protein